MCNMTNAMGIVYLFLLFHGSNYFYFTNTIYIFFSANIVYFIQNIDAHSLQVETMDKIVNKGMGQLENLLRIFQLKGSELEDRITLKIKVPFFTP